LRPKIGEKAVNDRQHPAAFDERFRNGMSHRLDHVQTRGVLKREHVSATAALLRPFTADHFDQRRRKERAESTPVLTWSLESVTLDERRQEPLRHVVRIS
jgi:hypothetical protein